MDNIRYKYLVGSVRIYKPQIAQRYVDLYILCDFKNSDYNFIYRRKYYLNSYSVLMLDKQISLSNLYYPFGLYLLPKKQCIYRMSVHRSIKKYHPYKKAYPANWSKAGISKGKGKSSSEKLIEYAVNWYLILA